MTLLKGILSRRINPVNTTITVEGDVGFAGVVIADAEFAGGHGQTAIRSANSASAAAAPAKSSSAVPPPANSTSA